MNESMNEVRSLLCWNQKRKRKNWFWSQKNKNKKFSEVIIFFLIFFFWFFLVQSTLNSKTLSPNSIQKHKFKKSFNWIWIFVVFYFILFYFILFCNQQETRKVFEKKRRRKKKKAIFFCFFFFGLVCLTFKFSNKHKSQERKIKKGVLFVYLL